MRLLLISPPHVYATQRLVAEAKQRGDTITTLAIPAVIERGYAVDPGEFDALFIRQAYIDFKHQASTKHLQSLVNLAHTFLAAGKVVVDTAIASGDLGQGKLAALQQLQRAGVVVPHTALLRQELPWQLPVVAKWNYGFGAQHTYLVKNSNDVDKVKQRYPLDEMLGQEFIPADFEYKVITVGYQSLPRVIKLRTTDSKFLADLKHPEVVVAASVPAVVQMAEHASRVLQRELAKVDLVEAAGQLYVLEVNRWPGLHYFEKTTGYNVAGQFLRYIAGRKPRL